MIRSVFSLKTLDKAANMKYNVCVWAKASVNDGKTIICGRFIFFDKEDENL